MRFGPGIGIKGCSAPCPGTAISYLFRDDFTTDESAPIASPRTAEPGPGTLTVVQTDGQFSIVGSKLVFPAQSSPVWGDQGMQSGALSRVAGRVLVSTVALSTFSFTELLAWFKASNLSDSSRAYVLDTSPSTVLRKWTSTSGGSQVAVIAVATEYLLAIALRSSGCFFFIKGGTFANWTLLFVTEEGADATLYAAIRNYSGAGTIDNLRIPDLLYTPTPLVSDSFNRGDSSDLGSTDGAGAEEAGGDGVAWVDLLGDASIASSQFTNGDSNVVSVAESGESDVIIQASMTLVDYPGVGMLVLRAADVDNYWQVGFVDGNSEFAMYENVGGTFTKRAFTSFSTTPSTTYAVLAVADGQTITGYINGGNRISYASAASGETNTKHGLKCDNGGISGTVTADNFIVWPRTLPAADQATLDSI